MNKFYHSVPFLIQNLFFVFFLPIYKTFLRLEIKGEENLKNLKGPIILAPNHTNELDPTVIPLIFPFFSKLLPIYSVIYPIAKYKTPEWKWRRYIYGEFFFQILGGYPTYSGNKDYRVALMDHITLLKKGRTVCIFPEGKCTLDGNLNKAHGGIGYLAYVTKATIVPLSINTFFGLSLKDFVLRRKKLILTILPPVTFNDLIKTERPTVEDFKTAGDMVIGRIREAI